MTTVEPGAAINSPYRNGERLHFRVLILDPDENRTARLEHSFLSMYALNGTQRAQSEIAVQENAQFYYVRNSRQLSTIPGASAYNAAWISSDFPDYLDISRRIYFENPFCYQVFYGEPPDPATGFLRSRPIGYVADVANPDSVYGEMRYIWTISSRERGTLKLTSRSSFCTVALDSILYCQSQGHKSYIYVNTPASGVNMAAGDIFVKSTDNPYELFAYIQSKKLSEIAALLPEDGFVRVHQSYIVNRAHATGIRTKREGWFLIVTDSRNHIAEIPVSERYYDQAKAIFGLEKNEK